jgi:hypothetical protein
MNYPQEHSSMDPLPLVEDDFIRNSHPGGSATTDGIQEEHKKGSPQGAFSKNLSR